MRQTFFGDGLEHSQLLQDVVYVDFLAEVHHFTLQNAVFSPGLLQGIEAANLPEDSSQVVAENAAEGPLDVLSDFIALLVRVLLL